MRRKKKQQIELEIKKRAEDCESDDILLTAVQYRLLRTIGKTKKEVLELEKNIGNEIDERNARSQVFLPSLWIKKRVEGFLPDQIEYDWVHAFR